MNELPPKPSPPEPGDCCGGGCARCVHDVYAELLQIWEKQVAEIRRRQGPTSEDPPSP